MLSYRHGFHAGNHGDVLKHLTQMLIIEKLLVKAKPFVYIDTHSGAGCYDLAADEAQKTAEYEQGIGRLQPQQANDASLVRYQALLQPYLAQQQYPGSPVIAASLLRDTDHIELMELHNTEIGNLKTNLARYRKQQSEQTAHQSIHHRDGFEGLVAILPHAIKRGLVLIDPSYEIASDYQQVVSAVKQAYKRWPTGIFAIWYPLLTQRAKNKAGKSEWMLEQLVQLGPKNMLVAELAVDDPAKDGGMYGSGMAILNAPWQVDELLASALAEVTPQLAQDDKAYHRISWMIESE